MGERRNARIQCDVHTQGPRGLSKQGTRQIAALLVASPTFRCPPRQGLRLGIDGVARRLAPRCCIRA